jgi:hypothetical protein
VVHRVWGRRANLAEYVAMDGVGPLTLAFSRMVVEKSWSRNWVADRQQI